MLVSLSFVSEWCACILCELQNPLLNVDVTV